MKIYIDGDGSPVKGETAYLANKYQLDLIIVTSIDHYSQSPISDQVKYVYVDQGPDAADFRLAGLVQAGDLVVTQDYGLAAILLPRVRVLSQAGFEYTSENIEGLLAQRFYHHQARQAGYKTKGQKPFSQADRDKFSYFLEQVIDQELQR
ncbi:hypothetical protein AWM75_03315 [Aerococcus urinaehominis]|uniref:UPF0178 protein AWM75_03315 n=1 Tax=Aerococcus urinaehominis TaxID=128944 RepID=A0A0X8FKN7_9LACT|nr:DUF188 domain-containing protein [Aerococcus urinaehominis]AMB99088.1 hypothetical protein AWM75_03315 [Aerococcus urinaehominis]SDM03227.1 hypothetical protein SAMN04487985_10421 [Aerococcus urinaehominis]